MCGSCISNFTHLQLFVYYISHFIHKNYTRKTFKKFKNLITCYKKLNIIIQYKTMYFITKYNILTTLKL